MTVSVMDESRSTRADAIPINVFYPTIAQMPKIKVRKRREDISTCSFVIAVTDHGLNRSMLETSSVFTKSKSRNTKATFKVSVCEYI